MRILLVLLSLIALPAAAQDFGARYPAGSIRDDAQARVVLKEADAEMVRIARVASERDAECLRGFLVNSCRDDVRREKELAEREVRRVRVEARDVQRRIEAEKVARRRADQQAARAVEDAQRPQKESHSLDAAKAREADAKQRDVPAAKPGKDDQRSEAKASERGPVPAQPRLTAEERAENVRKFQQKQEQAQKRAQEQEAKRIENEQRRAEKRKQIEAQEAAREEIRKKAAESLK